MRKYIITILLFLPLSYILAQDTVTEEIKKPVENIFKGIIYEAEHNLCIRMNFYDNNITIKGQEFMGEMSGYIDDEKDFRNWLIVENEIISPTKAILQIINDECSEDLEAELTYDEESDTFTLKQLDGSTLKIARNRKWVKLPKTLTFTRTRMPQK